MADSVRADTLAADDSVLAAGIGLTLLSLAGLVVPVSRGLSDPVIWAAFGLALLTLTVFLARYWGALERSIGGPVAAVSSGGVVLFSGYALNQGVTGGVPIFGPGFGLSIPVVFGTFLVAGVVTALAIADYSGLSNDDVLSRLGWFLAGCGIAIASQAATIVFGVLLLSIGLVAVGSLSDPQTTVATQLGMAIGVTVVTAAYLSLSDQTVDFLDIRVPSLREAAWLVGGLVGIFAALLAVSALMTATGTESASHTTEQQAQQNPEALLILIPLAILIIGPFEELLYRNVIQKSLYGYFSRAGAVVVASVIFAAVHILAYWTAGPGAVLGSLGVVFALSLVLGAIYERTDNLVVPALVHGVYDAFVFASLYLTYL